MANRGRGKKCGVDQPLFKVTHLVALCSATRLRQHLTHCRCRCSCCCMQVLQETLPVLFSRVKPELCLYNAGVDVHKDDQLGLLALSNAGIAARDRLVLDACLEAGVPLAAAIGGGYQKDHMHIVDRHVHLHRAAAERMPRFAEMVQRKRRARAELRQRA